METGEALEIVFTLAKKEYHRFEESYVSKKKLKEAFDIVEDLIVNNFEE